MRADKPALRKEMQKKRKELTNKEYIDARIFKNLFSLEAVLHSKTVFCYVSTEFEVDTWNVIDRLIELDKTVCVPKVKKGENFMDAVKISNRNDLTPGEFNILEPPKTEITDKSNIDIALVPGLCFDIRGHRLGYGKGFYDRYLSDFEGLKIGLCRDEFLLDTLPFDPTDISVDIIVTENKIIRI